MEDSFKKALDTYWLVNCAISEFKIPGDLNNKQITVLYKVFLYGEINLKVIKEKMMKNVRQDEKKRLNVRVSKIMNVLLDKKYITKEKSGHDNRVIHLTITPEGKKVVLQFLKLGEEKWKEKNYE